MRREWIQVMGATAVLLMGWHGTPVGAAAGAAPAPRATALVQPATTFIDQVRQATAVFSDANQAGNAQYNPFLGCVSGPDEGAMGVHFVNLGFVGDGELDVNRPEALIYEPTSAGLRLVAVEYIVVADTWNAAHAQPPVLGGQVFQFNESPNRYGLPAFYDLHVWAWRENPRGAFAEWNPRVSCEGL